MRRESEILLEKLCSADKIDFWKRIRKHVRPSCNGVQIGMARTDSNISKFWKDYYQKLGYIQDQRYCVSLNNQLDRMKEDMRKEPRGGSLS